MVVALALLRPLWGWMAWRQRIPRAEKASACSVLMKKVVSPVLIKRISASNDTQQWKSEKVIEDGRINA